MAENKEHFRHIMLFYFRKGKNASQTQKKICAVYGECVRVPLTIPCAVSGSESFVKTILMLAMYILDD